MLRPARRPLLRPALALALAAGLASATLLPPGAARAQPRAEAVVPLSDTARLPLNQKRIRIEQLVGTIGEAVGRTILVPDDVRGNVSIVAKRPVSHAEAWGILDSALSMLGYSLLPSTAGTWRIAKIADAVGEAPFRERTGDESESFVTTLIPLRAARIEDVQPVLEPLAGTRVTLVPFERTNSLIASGSERSIARLTSIADELDRVEERTLRLRVLRYRGVDEVEPLVERYLETRWADTRSLQVWSDARTNALVVRGEAEGVERVAAFLDDIDQPIEGEGSLRILRVLHRDPEEVAELVRTLAESPTRAGADPRTLASATELDEADFTIAVDAPSRSLVVRATPEVQRTIRELVELLDAAPQLIAVDLLVSRVTMPSAYALAFGFRLPFATGDDFSDLVGVVQSTPALPDPSALPLPIPNQGFFGQLQTDTGVPSLPVQLPDGRIVDLSVAQAGPLVGVDANFRSDVLIQPSLVVTAGESHELFVGNNVPIPVTESAPGDTTSGTLSSALTQTTSFDRRDIGTRVSLEAGAGREGRVRLDLEIELSRVDFLRTGLAGDPSEVGPSYVNRLVTVTAQLADHESAVLATSERKKRTRTASGVPFLRHLPFVGWIFRSTSVIDEEEYLVLVARARRISSPAELVSDTIRRRLAFERSRARDRGLPEIQGPPYGVRVTTREREDDARSIAESLALRGFRTRTHRWSVSGRDYHDVYVIALDSMVDAADVARVLADEGWETDLVVFSTRS